MAARYAAEPRLVFACGRYEGIDGRVADAMRARMPVDEVSIGDYVLAGGEVAALVMLEAVGRLLPGVLGNASSAGDDSFGGDGDPAGAMRGLPRDPSTPGREPGESARCPRCCCRVTMPRSRAGVATWPAPDRRPPPDLIAALRDLDRRDRQVLAGFSLAIDKLLGNEIVIAHGPLMIAGALLLLAGLMMFSTGLIGEMMMRTYFESQDRRIYAVREILTRKQRGVAGGTR